MVIAKHLVIILHPCCPYGTTFVFCCLQCTDCFTLLPPPKSLCDSQGSKSSDASHTSSEPSAKAAGLPPKRASGKVRGKGLEPVEEEEPSEEDEVSLDL